MCAGRTPVLYGGDETTSTFLEKCQVCLGNAQVWINTRYTSWLVRFPSWMILFKPFIASYYLVSLVTLIVDGWRPAAWYSVLASFISLSHFIRHTSTAKRRGDDS